MGPTINELIYNIRGQLRISRPDDLTLSNRQIEFMINYLREKLIVQQLQKGRSISSNIKQDLGSVSVITVDKSEDAIKSMRYIIRTEQQIPQPIELDRKDLITFVGGLDKETDFTFKTKANVRWNKHNKYASKEPLAYYSEDYIYVTNLPNPLLEYINIEGVFLNPREVAKFKHKDGTPCYNPDVDSYPISGRMIDTINQLIKKQELAEFLQLVEDTSDNADSKS